MRSRDAKPDAAPVAAGADLIAVMPLSAVSDSSLARLGQDLVVTLSTNLDGVGSLHTVDAVTLLMRARKATSPMPLADARAMARDLGARSVLTGTLINQGDRVRASVTLHRVGSDSAIARATALAAPRDIAALTDSLTWAILRQVWQRGTPPSPVLTGLTTKSVDALRAFLDGERHFQRLEADQALADYRRAFELDSNFAQAYMRYSGVNWLEACAARHGGRSSPDRARRTGCPSANGSGWRPAGDASRFPRGSPRGRSSPRATRTIRRC